MEAAIAGMMLLISMGSIFLNVVLVNQRDYHRSGERAAETETKYWQGLALLYEGELREARDELRAVF